MFNQSYIPQIDPNQKFFLKSDFQENWTEVTREQYIKAELSVGFSSKFGPDFPATSAFSSGSIMGKAYE